MRRERFVRRSRPGRLAFGAILLGRQPHGINVDIVHRGALRVRGRILGYARDGAAHMEHDDVAARGFDAARVLGQQVDRLVCQRGQFARLPIAVPAVRRASVERGLQLDVRSRGDTIEERGAERAQGRNGAFPGFVVTRPADEDQTHRPAVHRRWKRRAGRRVAQHHDRRKIVRRALDDVTVVS